jgi:hypothetical protein
MNNQERSSPRLISFLMSRAPGGKRRPPIRIFYQRWAASATMLLDMSKGRHPKLVHTWMADKIRKLMWRQRRGAAVLHKPEPHNKT